MSGNEPSIDEVRKMYNEATSKGWRTVEATTKQAVERHLASRVAAAESAELMKIAREILRGEPAA